ncbi:MAG: hypothetical protein P8N09_04290, partial [Planctomycetota bacterium]|nr:hypothetical protein [Planctomycetota bacterium]
EDFGGALTMKMSAKHLEYNSSLVVSSNDQVGLVFRPGSSVSIKSPSGQISEFRIDFIGYLVDE